MITAKPMKIAKLEELARDMIGDDRKPDLYFVTLQGVVITITRNIQLAHEEWKQLTRELVECAVENRQFGTLCSMEPDENGKLYIRDDMRDFRCRD